MGIRFRCHHCEHEMNLKNFQAGKRARCPECSNRFRVPNESRDFSLPLEEDEAELAAVKNASSGSTTESFQLQQPSEPSQANRSAKHSASASGNATLSATSNSTSTGNMAPGNMVPGSMVPKAVAEAPQAVWYVRPPSGGQYGPADAHVFLQWIQENRISRDAYVWRDGWPQWMIAADAFEEYFGSNWIAEDFQENADSVDESEAANGVVPINGAAISETESGSEPVRDPVPKIRQKRKQSNHGLLIGMLAFLAIGLLVVLIAVLMMQ